MGQWYKQMNLGLMLGLTAFLLAGCATKGSNTAGPGAPISDQNTAATQSGAQTSGLQPGNVAGVDLTGQQGGGLNAADQSGMPREMRVHFALDSDTLDEANQSIVRAHASYMAAHPTLKVRLEGNTDERGTRAYNLALGERRALGVRNLLMANGISADRIEVISFGAEKPLVNGHDEMAWAENRRVDFVYSRP